MHIEIRNLKVDDPNVISAAFSKIGWNKPAAQYEKYLQEQDADERTVLVALANQAFSGYVTIRWQSEYEPFREKNIPEIEDFNVLPEYRRLKIGTALMDKAERLIAEHSDAAGIGVGMYPDYGNAQRLYVLRGYVPDGRGLTYKRKVLKPGDQAVNDDSLALFFIKDLR